MDGAVDAAALMAAMLPAEWMSNGLNWQATGSTPAGQLAVPSGFSVDGPVYSLLWSGRPVVASEMLW